MEPRGTANEPTEDEVRALWAANLVARRDAVGWTQAELARRAGVAQSRVSAMERGMQLGTIVLRFRLARAFGIEMDELFPNPRVFEAAS